MASARASRRYALPSAQVEQYDGDVHTVGDLVALLLPGNLEAQYSQLQAGLFQETGDALLRALAPLIPLYWARPIPETPAAAPAERSASAAYEKVFPYRSPFRLPEALHPGALSQSNACVFVPLTPKSAILSLASELKHYLPAATERDLPELPPGVLVGWRGASRPEMEPVNHYGDQSRPANSARIRSVSGTVLRLRADSASLSSCNRLDWVELTSFRVRRAPNRDRGF